jgi:hypothetical protein
VAVVRDPIPGADANPVGPRPDGQLSMPLFRCAQQNRGPALRNVGLAMIPIAEAIAQIPCTSQRAGT